MIRGLSFTQPTDFCNEESSATEYGFFPVKSRRELAQYSTKSFIRVGREGAGELIVSLPKRIATIAHAASKAVRRVRIFTLSLVRIRKTVRDRVGRANQNHGLPAIVAW